MASQRSNEQRQEESDSNPVIEFGLILFEALGSQIGLRGGAFVPPARVEVLGSRPRQA